MNAKLKGLLLILLFSLCHTIVYGQERIYIYWGPRKYEYIQLEYAMMDHSADDYFYNQGITGKDLSQIKSYIPLYLEAFKKGKIKKRVDGTFDVYDSRLITDNKPVKRNIFGKIKGDKKRLALGYIDSLFKYMTPIN